MFRIRVYENSSYQDEDEAYFLSGSFDAEQALAKCREIVDADLREHHKEGVSSEGLLIGYRMFGRDPVILGEGAPEFSAWSFAEERSREIAGQQPIGS